MPWQGEVKRSSRGLGLRIGAVESGPGVLGSLVGEWANSGLWRTHASTALLYSLVAPDSAEGAQCGKFEGSRATCPRQLFTEEGSVAVSSTVGGDRGIADVTSLSVQSQTARTGWVAVRSEEAGSVPFRLRL